MSLEAIRIISEAEDAARRSRQSAAAEAKKALAEAEGAGKAAIEDAVHKAEVELRELNKKADEKATNQALELAGATENKKAALRAHAQSKLDAAALLVVERIVNGAWPL